MKKQIELKVFNIEDRRLVAGILVANGYTVRQGKKRRDGTKTYDYILFCEENDKEVADDGHGK